MCYGSNLSLPYVWVIRGDVRWKHAREPEVESPKKPKAKPVSVWQRLNVAHKMSKSLAATKAGGQKQSAGSTKGATSATTVETGGRKKSLWGKAGALAKTSVGLGTNPGATMAERSLWRKAGKAVKAGTSVQRSYRRNTDDGVSGGEEEENGDDDEVYTGILDRARFHPNRYESKGETREEILRRYNGEGPTTAAEFMSEQARKKSNALAELMAVKARIRGNAATGVGEGADTGDENDGVMSNTLKTPKTRWKKGVRDVQRENSPLKAAQGRHVEKVLSTLMKAKQGRSKATPQRG